MQWITDGNCAVTVSMCRELVCGVLAKILEGLST